MSHLSPDVYYVQSRLKTFGGPRQNTNEGEGSHKMNFLVCFFIPLGIKMIFYLNTRIAIFLFWGPLKVIKKYNFQTQYRI